MHTDDVHTEDLSNILSCLMCMLTYSEVLLYRVGKSKETKSRLMVAKGWELGGNVMWLLLITRFGGVMKMF